MATSSWPQDRVKRSQVALLFDFFPFFNIFIFSYISKTTLGHNYSICVQCVQCPTSFCTTEWFHVKVYFDRIFFFFSTLFHSFGSLYNIMQVFVKISPLIEDLWCDCAFSWVQLGDQWVQSGAIKCNYSNQWENKESSLVRVCAWVCVCVCFDTTNDTPNYCNCQRGIHLTVLVIAVV